MFMHEKSVIFGIYLNDRTFVCLILYIPVNNFSFMSGWVFLSWICTKERIKWLAQGHNAVPKNDVFLAHLIVIWICVTNYVFRKWNQDSVLAFITDVFTYIIERNDKLLNLTLVGHLIKIWWKSHNEIIVLTLNIWSQYFFTTRLSKFQRPTCGWHPLRCEHQSLMSHILWSILSAILFNASFNKNLSSGSMV